MNTLPTSPSQLSLYRKVACTLRPRRFQHLCEEAFIILRRHGSLIISLFAMMVTTGMPELTSEKDLDYLRDALVLDYSENDALSHFRAKFEEAVSNSWTTSINWVVHNISKDNK